MPPVPCRFDTALSGEAVTYDIVLKDGNLHSYVDDQKTVKGFFALSNDISDRTRESCSSRYRRFVEVADRIINMEDGRLVSVHR